MCLRKSLALAFAMLLITWVAARAQKTPEDVPKYNVKSEVTIQGSVEEIKEVPNPKGQIGIYLMMKSGGEVLEVRLCPNSFLKEFEVVFHKGDQLTITGSKVKVEEKTVILARQIEFGNNKITLRDPQGVPVWTWLTKGGSH